MRYLNVLMGILMLAFVAVQYNDPDGPLWMAIYSIPMIWAFLAAFRLPLLRTPLGSRLLQLSVLAGVAAVAYYWPQMPGFWHKEVWWNEETAREGMGVMLLLIVLLVAWISSLRGGAAVGRA